MAGVLPSNVSYFMSRMQGCSSSHFKIFAQSSDTATSGKIIRFELPSNALINTRSIRFLANAECKGASTGGRLPNKFDSLISRVAVYMGGVLVQNNFNDYHLLRHAKDALTGDKCHPTLGHPEIVRAKSYHTGGAALTGTNPEVITDKDDQLCIDYFDGLLGSIEPSIIDTGLLPQITLEFTLADDAVCPSVAGITEAFGGVDGSNGTIDKFSGVATTYELTNLSVQVEVLGMATSVLEEIQEARISQVGYLSLPFKNYHTSASRHTTNSRFSVNSASWDRLWLVYRPTNYASPAGAKLINGYVGKIGGGATAAPQYDTHGVFDTNKEKYTSNYFNMKQVLTDSSIPAFYQLQVNGASVPAYRMNTPEAFAMSMNSVDGRKNPNLTLDQYKNNYMVQCFRFCLPDSDFSRLASGLDTRSTSAQCSLDTENVKECNLTIFAESTAELRVGAGRSIEVIG